MSFNIKYNKNQTKQIEQAVKVLASWIGEPDSSSTKIFKFLTLENNSEEIQKLNLEKTNNLKKIDDFYILSNSSENKNEILIT